MEISRYASRLALRSPVLPSGRPLLTEENPGDDATPATSDPLWASLELPQEPEDAVLTGGTRSLSRRLLALNIPGISAIQPSSGKLPQKASAQKVRARKVIFTPPGLTPQDA